MIKKHCAHVTLFEVQQIAEVKVWVRGFVDLSMECVFKEKRKRRGKQMGDEFLWYVSNNTPYWFLTGVINRICEAKLMKVSAINGTPHTDTHREWAGFGEFLFRPFKRVGRAAEHSRLLGSNLSREETVAERVWLWREMCSGIVTEGTFWKEVARRLKEEMAARLQDGAKVRLEKHANDCYNLFLRALIHLTCSQTDSWVDCKWVFTCTSMFHRKACYGLEYGDHSFVVVNFGNRLIV